MSVSVRDDTQQATQRNTGTTEAVYYLPTEGEGTLRAIGKVLGTLYTIVVGGSQRETHLWAEAFIGTQGITQAVFQGAL